MKTVDCTDRKNSKYIIEKWFSYDKNGIVNMMTANEGHSNNCIDAHILSRKKGISYAKARNLISVLFASVFCVMVVFMCVVICITEGMAITDLAIGDIITFLLITFLLSPFIFYVLWRFIFMCHENEVYKYINKVKK